MVQGLGGEAALVVDDAALVAPEEEVVGRDISKHGAVFKGLNECARVVRTRNLLIARGVRILTGCT